jgi:glycosidase
MQNRENSSYRNWYRNVDFSKRSPAGDPFNYEGWAGCYDLVKLDGNNPDVQAHLFKAVDFWINEFGIDGLRLDAAADLAPAFMDALSEHCKKIKKDFWLMGEVVAGDYRHWAHEGRLDSVTNFELYKSLWSSFNDKNFFELSWTMKRCEDLYRHIRLYNFADNHDVNRVASSLLNKDHLISLYGILFTLPGIPSIYYGSEYAVSGERTKDGDAGLRPKWDHAWENAGGIGGKLCEAIRNFIRIRKENPCLSRGSCRQVLINHEQFAFIREEGDAAILVVVNASEKNVDIKIPEKRQWKALLGPGVFQGLMAPRSIGIFQGS